MHFRALLAALVPAVVVEAHFRMNVYPYWRGDALAPSNNASITEWQFPCAGFSQEFSANNRTLWPLNGGPIIFNSSHHWTLAFINLGLGDRVETFNITLQPMYNSTGAGQTCLPNPGADVIRGLGIKEGQNASIQVITLSTSGQSLMNCADITFSSRAVVPDQSVCYNASGVGGAYLMNANSQQQQQQQQGGNGSGSTLVPTGGAVRNYVSVATVAFIGAAAAVLL